MLAKSLRELQQKGEKALEDKEPVLLTTRNGPIGILIPVDMNSLPELQRDLQRIIAMKSLRDTWSRARSTQLDKLTDDDIQDEIKLVRKGKKAKRKNSRGQSKHRT